MGGDAGEKLNSAHWMCQIGEETKQCTLDVLDTGREGCRWVLSKTRSTPKCQREQTFVLNRGAKRKE
jgi:hypothetical protein